MKERVRAALAYRGRMKIFLTKKSYFTFRGIASYDLDLLGKSAYTLMQERLSAADEQEFTGVGIVLDPVFPFLTRERLLSYLDGREGSYRFPGGYIVRAGEQMSETPRVSLNGLGLPLFSLSDLPAVLSEVARESAVLHLAQGALVEEGAQVDYTAVLGAGSIVRSGSRVRGKSVIGENAELIASDIADSEIGANTVVRQSTIIGAKIGENCTVGPYAFLRAESEVENNCRIGDFVELKNAKIGRGTKISHLAYVGDADVGERVNVGCGAVFVNYNGRAKFRTRVGNRCFIGSNCNLIAPLEIGDNAFIAAGSTVTQNLKREDFCIARSREVVKPQRGSNYYDPK